MRSFMGQSLVSSRAIAVPLTIPGLALWLDASSGDLAVSNGGARAGDGEGVGWWPDKSGNSNDALQTTEASRPKWDESDAGINGLSAVTFNGTDEDMVDINKVAGLPGETWIWVAKVTALASTGFLIDAGLLVGSRIRFTNGTPDEWCFRDRESDPTILSDSPVELDDADWHIVVGTVSDTEKIAQIYLDGTAGTAGTTLTKDLDILAGAETSVILGSQDSFANYFKGSVAEMLNYNTKLSLTNINIVANYLKAKYGLTWVDLS